jgi:hypothetical protein
MRHRALAVIASALASVLACSPAAGPPVANASAQAIAPAASAPASGGAGDGGAPVVTQTDPGARSPTPAPSSGQVPMHLAVDGCDTEVDRIQGRTHLHRVTWRAGAVSREIFRCDLAFAHLEGDRFVPDPKLVAGLQRDESNRHLLGMPPQVFGRFPDALFLWMGDANGGGTGESGVLYRWRNAAWEARQSITRAQIQRVMPLEDGGAMIVYLLNGSGLEFDLVDAARFLVPSGVPALSKVGCYQGGWPEAIERLSSGEIVVASPCQLESVRAPFVVTYSPATKRWTERRFPGADAPHGVMVAPLPGGRALLALVDQIGRPTWDRGKTTPVALFEAGEWRPVTETPTLGLPESPTSFVQARGVTWAVAAGKLWRRGADSEPWRPVELDGGAPVKEVLPGGEGDVWVRAGQRLWTDRPIAAPWACR